MTEMITIEQAKSIMGDNFLGPDRLIEIGLFDIDSLQNVPAIPFKVNILEEKKNDYLLIFGVRKLANGNNVTIRNLIDIYGKDPEQHEPCFYNQDWYDKETFIDTAMDNEWFLIRRNVYENSRAAQPTELMHKYIFPSAVKCVYSFFVSWLALDSKLWYHDFVWCSDTDHNGDRIYVGKYHDVDGVNKNGFSIHRHLALRPCYGCID